MRFYGKDGSLNETEALGEYITQVRGNYAEFRARTDEENWGTIPTEGARAAFNLGCGIGPLTRDEMLTAINWCIRAMHCEGVYSGKAGDNRWERDQAFPTIDDLSWAQSRVRLPYSWRCRTVQAFIYGPSDFPEGGKTGTGPGYFASYGLVGDGATTASQPTVTAIDIASWDEFRQGANRGSQRRQGVTFNEINETGLRNYKVLVMARNTLDISINPSIGWLVPGVALSFNAVNDAIRIINDAANGTNIAAMRKLLIDNFLSFSPASGDPVPWRIEGHEAKVTYNWNTNFMNSQVRSWAQGIMAFTHPAFPGRDWQWFLRQGITFEDIRTGLTEDPLGIETEGTFPPQLMAAGLIRRLTIQQREAPINILNQRITPEPPDWWPKTPTQEEEEEEE